MGMFDYFRPASPQLCPVCRRALNEWQGKDGPNGLFVWSERTPFPIDQVVDEDVRLGPSERERVRLPARFVIYSYDCPDHHPIEAECTTEDGVWIVTVLRPY